MSRIFGGPMSYPSRCGGCDSAEPHWQILRIGDVVVTWACDAHLAAACESLQRDYEITNLSVTDFRKRTEWADINSALNQIAVTSE